jgi:hypothetical protein
MHFLLYLLFYVAASAARVVIPAHTHAKGTAHTPTKSIDACDAIEVPESCFAFSTDEATSTSIDEATSTADSATEETTSTNADVPDEAASTADSATKEAAYSSADSATDTATSTGTKSATSSTPASITAAPGPLPSCLLHPESPDQGINAPYCVCDGSHTLSPLPATSEYSESCAYKSIPTDTTAIVTVTTQTVIYTTNCSACTIVGGIADVASCTSVAGCTPTAPPAPPTPPAPPSPTISAWVGNLSTVPIGNAADVNGGKDLATEMFGKLKAMCSGASYTCKGSAANAAEMDNVNTVIANGEENLTPTMYLQDIV